MQAREGIPLLKLPIDSSSSAKPERFALEQVPDLLAVCPSSVKDFVDTVKAQEREQQHRAVCFAGTETGLVCLRADAPSWLNQWVGSARGVLCLNMRPSFLLGVLATFVPPWADEVHRLGQALDALRCSDAALAFGISRGAGLSASIFWIRRDPAVIEELCTDPTRAAAVVKALARKPQLLGLWRAMRALYTGDVAAACEHLNVERSDLLACFAAMPLRDKPIELRMRKDKMPALDAGRARVAALALYVQLYSQVCEQLGLIGNCDGECQCTFFLYCLSSTQGSAAKGLSDMTAHFLNGYIAFAAHDLATAPPPTPARHRRSLSQPTRQVEHPAASSSSSSCPDVASAASTAAKPEQDLADAAILLEELVRGVTRSDDGDAIRITIHSTTAVSRHTTLTFIGFDIDFVRGATGCTRVVLGPDAEDACYILGLHHHVSARAVWFKGLYQVPVFVRRYAALCSTPRTDGDFAMACDICDAAELDAEAGVVGTKLVGLTSSAVDVLDLRLSELAHVASARCDEYRRRLYVESSRCEYAFPQEHAWLRRMSSRVSKTRTPRSGRGTAVTPELLGTALATTLSADNAATTEERSVLVLRLMRARGWLETESLHTAAAKVLSDRALGPESMMRLSFSVAHAVLLSCCMATACGALAETEANALVALALEPALVHYTHTKTDECIELFEKGAPRKKSLGRFVTEEAQTYVMRTVFNGTALDGLIMQHCEYALLLRCLALVHNRPEAEALAAAVRFCEWIEEDHEGDATGFAALRLPMKLLCVQSKAERATYLQSYNSSVSLHCVEAVRLVMCCPDSAATVALLQTPQPPPPWPADLRRALTAESAAAVAEHLLARNPRDAIVQSVFR